MNKNKEIFSVGNVYEIQLKTGMIISGLLIAKIECLVEEKTETHYRFAFNGSKYVDLCENEIESVYLPEIKEKIEYLSEFEKKHDTKCFDEENNILDSSTILKEVLSKDIWNDLTSEDREKLISYIEPNVEDIVDVINAYVVSKKESEKLFRSEKKILDSMNKLMKNYCNSEKRNSYSRTMYDFLFKELGIEKFLKDIC